MSVDRTTEIITNQIDRATNAQNTIDYAHHEIHSGSHYFNDFSIDIPASDWLDVRFTTPNTTKWLHMLISIKTQEEGLYQLYETAPTLTAGTALVAENNNRNTPNSSGISAFDYIINTTEENANLDTNTSGATLLRSALLGSNQGNLSGVTRNENELVLKQNTAYLIRVNNKISSVRYCSWVLDWYEHTSKG